MKVLQTTTNSRGETVLVYETAEGRPMCSCLLGHEGGLYEGGWYDFYHLYKERKPLAPGSPRCKHMAQAGVRP